MHVIQHGHVVTLPDDVPLPAGSVRLEPPEEYLERPERFVVAGDELVRRADDELPQPASDEPALELTQDEVRVLKEAVAGGALTPKPKPQSRQSAQGKRS